MGIIGHIAKGFGRAVAEARAGMAAGARSISPDMKDWMNGADVTDEQGAKMVLPYAQSAWVYTAVSVMAESLAQIPFRVSRVGGNARRVRAMRGSADPRQREVCRRALGGSIIESGDVVDLFANPHPTMDGTLFWEQVPRWGGTSV